MNNVNKTLYIPLYGKAYVSQRGLFIEDKTAEKIWSAEGFKLKGKSRSKWLAYYMGIRAAVFDNWVTDVAKRMQDAVILHLGCGMDSRIMRVGHAADFKKWYDVDFPQVIKERERYFNESESYVMISADVRNSQWLEEIPKAENAIVVMEGLSMYMSPEELKALLENLCNRFTSLALLMDCYSTLAAKLSKIKNPINDVGVTSVYGIDDPLTLQQSGLSFVAEHNMTPDSYSDQLKGAERSIFKKLYAGRFSKKLYRLYEYEKI